MCEGKPGKRKQKAATLQRDSEIFREACENLCIIPAKEAKWTFGVTRQTVTSWMQGITSPPREAFIRLVARYNAEQKKGMEAMQRRMDEQGDIIAALQKRLNGLEAGNQARPEDVRTMPEDATEGQALPPSWMSAG